MKKISSLLIGASFAIIASTGFASSSTDLKNNWKCTTNASSSADATDKRADQQMSNTKSAKDAFSFASKNCRDCTKITCESSS